MTIRQKCLEIWDSFKGFDFNSLWFSYLELVFITWLVCSYTSLEPCLIFYDLNAFGDFSWLISLWYISGDYGLFDGAVLMSYYEYSTFCWICAFHIKIHTLNTTTIHYVWKGLIFSWNAAEILSLNCSQDCSK